MLNLDDKSLYVLALHSTWDTPQSLPCLPCKVICTSPAGASHRREAWRGRGGTVRVKGWDSRVEGLGQGQGLDRTWEYG